MYEAEVINEEFGAYQNIIKTGLRLASLPESQGGWAEYFDPEKGLDIENKHLKAATAIQLENTKRWLWNASGSRRDRNGRAVISEAVKSALLGGYQDYIYPVIRASVPTNPINDIVSLQPTNQQAATIVYYSWVYGNTKAPYTSGQKMFDPISGVPTVSDNLNLQSYSGERVSGEQTAGPANQTFTYTLGWVAGGIRPGTVAIALNHSVGGDVVFQDNGNGGFVQTSGTAVVIIAPSTINYATGAIVLTAPAATQWDADTIFIGYTVVSEGSAPPVVDVQITTSTVETVRRALKLNYSAEAMQTVRAQFGTDLEADLVAGITSQLNSEIARQVVSEMYRAAPLAGGSTTGVFLRTFSGISQEQHFRSIMSMFIAASNSIYSRTQRGQGTFAICSMEACNIIETLPRDLFERAPYSSTAPGMKFIGTLGGQFKIYKDVHLSNENVTGSVGGARPANTVGDVLVGSRGEGIADAGLIYAPWLPLYSTPTLQTADFMSQKGMATRYATKMVNPQMYARFHITSA